MQGSQRELRREPGVHAGFLTQRPFPVGLNVLSLASAQAQPGVTSALIEPKYVAFNNLVGILLASCLGVCWRRKGRA